jgi:hypothetical protein
VTVHIRFDGDVTLDDHEAWPDGVPEGPTAEAFALMMERDGPKWRTLSDYSLTPAVLVYVSIDDGPEVEVWPFPRRIVDRDDPAG